MESKLEDFTFIVEEALVETYNDFTIDYSDNFLRKGFSVTPKGYSGGGC